MWELFRQKVDEGLIHMVGMFLGLSMLFVFSDAMLRVLFGYSIFWLQEVILYFIIWSTMIGAAVAVRHNEHIKVDFLIEKLKPQHQFILNLATSMIGLIFSIVFTVSGLKLVIDAYTTEVASITTLETPLWIPYLILPITGIIFVIGFIDWIFSMIRKRALLEPDRK